MIEHACEYCGKIKQYRSPSLVKRFCSHRCSNQWKWENVRKRAENISFICENCGKTFLIQKSAAKIRKNKIRFCCSPYFLQANFIAAICATHASLALSVISSNVASCCLFS